MKHFKEKLDNHEIVFSKVVVDYMRDPFNQSYIKAFKKMFKGFPYWPNMHTLTEEQVAHLGDNKNCVNVNGECVDQLYLAAPIYHIFLQLNMTLPQAKT